jgi:hypothetical protein
VRITAGFLVAASLFLAGSAGATQPPPAAPRLPPCPPAARQAEDTAQRGLNVAGMLGNMVQYPGRGFQGLVNMGRQALSTARIATPPPRPACDPTGGQGR